MNKEQFNLYIKNIELIIISLTLFITPLLFLGVTLEPIVFPKQLFVTASTLILLLLFSIRSVIDGKITIKSSPFTVPFTLFGLAVLLSTFFSRNLFDSILSTIPFLGLILFYFLIVNSIEDNLSLKIAIFSLLGGGVLSVLISVLHYFKLYIFPFAFSQNQFFNTFGSPVQQIIYLLGILILSLGMVFHERKNWFSNINNLPYIICSALTFGGIAFLVYQIVTSQTQPPLLPFQYGFQISMASISQDSQRLLQSFLIGSGYGTFAVDFTRFKLPSYNDLSNYWNVVFSFSSSYLLEIVATVGILGFISYLFIFLKLIKGKNIASSGIFIAAVSVFILTFILPFSYTPLFLLFSLIALYVSHLYINSQEQVFNMSVSLVALKQGLLNFSSDEKLLGVEKVGNKILPILLLVMFTSLTLFIGIFGGKLLLSDMKFKSSLSQETLRQGSESYNLQRSALSEFPFRSDYHRVFSQLNLALATSILNNTPKGSSPSAQAQQTSLRLIQQSINSGRTAVSISPLTASNWQSLSGVYRTLINVGRNADQFAITSISQAIALDPSNPLLYIELGGIYYQLNQYEAAQNQFISSIRLKKDLPNAYYNLGHALQAKGDLQNAMTQYVTVRNLVKDNKQNLDKINAEIDQLNKKIGDLAKGKETTKVLGENASPQAGSDSQPLEISTPSAKLPERQPPISIPPPTATGSAR